MGKVGRRYKKGSQWESKAPWECVGVAWKAQVEGLSIRHLGAPFLQVRACEQDERWARAHTDERDGSERLLSCHMCQDIWVTSGLEW